MNTPSADRLTRTFAALADPTRRAILARLANGEATVSELAEPFSISVQAVSKHLAVLERAGLITRGRSAQLRPSRLRAEPLKDAADWLDAYQRFWDPGVDGLGDRARAPTPRARAAATNDGRAAGTNDGRDGAINDAPAAATEGP